MNHPGSPDATPPAPAAGPDPSARTVSPPPVPAGRAPATQADKAALRRQLVEWARGRTEEARAEESRRICDRLRGEDEWVRAAAVLLYAPMAVEPDVWPLVGEALAAGKQVALPRYVPSRRAYEARRIRNPEADVRVGRFGIREPARHCAVLALKRLDFVLVPGVAFDTCGRRLGRGKGYYDRLLARVRGMTCGIAFDGQVLAEVPFEPHDVPLNCILTPTRCLRFSSPGRF
ncbi:MAG: 5-formyltetrahydrofolate cyclo-ligase [Verrucomicrobia bacterium]|nr:5-formyltetrahydrofolate cyclo-ligase [Verrucomicrobiota bacterium]